MAAGVADTGSREPSRSEGVHKAIGCDADAAAETSVMAVTMWPNVVPERQL